MRYGMCSLALMRLNVVDMKCIKISLNSLVKLLDSQLSHYNFTIMVNMVEQTMPVSDVVVYNETTKTNQ